MYVLTLPTVIFNQFLIELPSLCLLEFLASSYPTSSFASFSSQPITSLFSSSYLLAVPSPPLPPISFRVSFWHLFICLCYQLLSLSSYHVFLHKYLYYFHKKHHQFKNTIAT